MMINATPTKLGRKFEKFTGGPTVPKKDRVHVTLNQKGRILLNRKVYELLKRPEAVFLYYSREDDTIAIEPTSPRLAGAFPVVSKDAYFLIHASPLCRHYGIRITTTEKFIHPEIDQGILRLKLGETITVSGCRKKRQPKAAIERNQDMP
jgi:hypothetical protein